MKIKYNNMKDIKPTDKVCMNCKFRLWGVALGVGVLCSHDKNRKNEKMMQLPSRRYTCEYFEMRKEEMQWKNNQYYRIR